MLTDRFHMITLNTKSIVIFAESKTFTQNSYNSKKINYRRHGNASYEVKVESFLTDI